MDDVLEDFETPTRMDNIFSVQKSHTYYITQSSFCLHHTTSVWKDPRQLQIFAEFGMYLTRAIWRRHQRRPRWPGSLQCHISARRSWRAMWRSAIICASLLPAAVGQFGKSLQLPRLGPPRARQMEPARICPAGILVTGDSRSREPARPAAGRLPDPPGGILRRLEAPFPPARCP